MSETREDRIKRLTYRAGRRGFKEADLLIGGFARARLPELSAADLDAFEALLNESDRDLYDWIVSGAEAPSAHDTAVLEALRDFARAGGPAWELTGQSARG